MLTETKIKFLENSIECPRSLGVDPFAMMRTGGHRGRTKNHGKHEHSARDVRRTGGRKGDHGHGGNRPRTDVGRIPDSEVDRHAAELRCHDANATGDRKSVE